MDIMNDEKMYPRGNGMDPGSWHSWRDGTHRKTNKYMDPSKHVCVRPSTSKRGSEQQSLRYQTIYDLVCQKHTLTDDIPGLAQTTDLQNVVVGYSTSSTVIF